MNKVLQILLIFTLFIAKESSGQLGNYWTLQVSTEGTLLSGALVAAKSNNAGFFYNPASMSSNQESSFSFNTSFFRVYSLDYKNPFGENTELTHFTGNFDPIFLSFLVPKKNKLDIKLGISIMGKQNTDIRLEDRVFIKDYSFPNLSTSLGDYEGIYDYRLRSSEYWVNLSASKKFNEKFSLGVTTIIAYRSLDYENNILSNFVSSNFLDLNSTSSFQTLTKSFMYNYKLIFKVGAIYTLNDHSRLGLNITTRSYNIYGRGSNKKSVSQTNIGNLILDTTGVLIDDHLLSSYADNLKANFKSPFSIALGYNIEFERDEFGIAIEYFNEIEPYRVITGEETGEFINTTTNLVSETDFLDLSYGQKSIMNIAISYERHINEIFTMLTGFRTNFTTSLGNDYEEEFQFNHIQDIDINYYHFTGGSTFTLLNNKFIFGADIAISFNSGLPNVVNFSEPLVINDQGFPLRGDLQNNASIRNFMIGFVLGYSLKF